MINDSSELLSLLLPPWLLGSCTAVAPAMTLPEVGEFTLSISTLVSTKSIFAFAVSSLGPSVPAATLLMGEFTSRLSPLVSKRFKSAFVVTSIGGSSLKAFSRLVGSLFGSVAGLLPLVPPKADISSITASSSVVTSSCGIVASNGFTDAVSSVSSLVITSNSTLHVLPIKSPASHTNGCNFFSNPALFAPAFMACTKYCVSSRESGTFSQYISLNVTVPL
mmetsp:Transcript_665/g.1214  ORF Transcript_665/g.1214 Transcript_665/m.1214 type:complete len:221 (-) Transcript_665:747-1409(-)